MGTPDTIPPSTPANLTAAATLATQINLSWTASTDNVGVVGYKVEPCSGAGCANFAQIAIPTGAAFDDIELAAATSYTYRVRAVDAAGITARTRMFFRPRLWRLRTRRHQRHRQI
ncbi:MAG TPA: fibronectin type III domain-containing protein [Candidatus Acidoferrum sp.]